MGNIIDMNYGNFHSIITYLLINIANERILLHQLHILHIS
jgi:hypothetical protein